MVEIDKIESAEEKASAARSNVYRLLSESLKYPCGEFGELVKDGTFLEGLYNLVGELPYDLPFPDENLGGRPLQAVDQDDIEAEFIRVFDVGPGGPPCPFREGLHHGSRMTIMEELVRFYNHFGLSTTKGEERELPDHLCTELEFLHFLTFKEVLALQEAQDPAPYRRAERDFLMRHVAKWLPMLVEGLDEFIGKDYKKVNKTVLLFYQELLSFASEFARRDLEHVSAQCKADE